MRELVEVRARKFGRDKYVSDQWSIKSTKYYPTTQRSMRETTGRRRRPHPNIQSMLTSNDPGLRDRIPTLYQFFACMTTHSEAQWASVYTQTRRSVVARSAPHAERRRSVQNRTTRPKKMSDKKGRLEIYRNTINSAVIILQLL